MDERIFWGLGLIYSTSELKGLDINSVTGEAQKSTAYMQSIDNANSTLAIPQALTVVAH